ncbi:hypothetical protein evm_004976 [Chilo suppressalis]|nr:hypothetical protein evm_004976 [Chilo suppressalis]
MNDPNSKKIIFNKSTLVSLKAELLKKQDEVKNKKQLHQHKLVNFKPPLTKKQAGVEKYHNDGKKSFKDSLKSVDADELEVNRRVRLALAKKSELYDHLADSSGSSQLAGQFLVDFNNKKLENEDNAEKYLETDYINKKEDDDEWVEFTDCLGRTRKCLKSDKEFYIKRDNELMKGLTRVQSSGEQQEAEDSNKTEMPFLVQKTNDYLQSLREKWEQKEKELVGKEKDIHYQDLLFDEARIHGVAYYSFSTDETERRKQMEELTKRRKETLQAQEESERLRKKRDELMAARVAAARARQRLRAGLPPEEPKDNQKDFTACLLEFLTEQKNEADEKAKEEERKAKEEQEKERQKLREAHIREWDLGKEGVEGKVKKFREMTQEEYVEQQRSKRIDEFAPPKALSSSRTDYTFDDKGRMIEPGSDTPVKKTWADVRPKTKTPPPPEIGDISFPDIQKGLYFSTSNKPSLTNYKNFVQTQEPTPIENELSDDEDISEQRKTEKRKFVSNHAEIEPPPTYDYYGPTPKCSRPQKPFNSDIREAYAQGAKSLENKGSDRQLSKQYDFTFD